MEALAEMIKKLAKKAMQKAAKKAAKKAGKAAIKEASGKNGGVVGEIVIAIVLLWIVLCAVIKTSGVPMAIEIGKAAVVRVVEKGAEVGTTIIKDAAGKVIEFQGNITAAIFGDSEDNDSEPIKDLQNAVDTYSLEDMIEAAGDEDWLTDEALENMMIDRESYKALLQSIYKYNTGKSSDLTTKRVQCKHTYTTRTVVKKDDDKNDVLTPGQKDKKDSEENKDPFLESTGNGKKDTFKDDLSTEVKSEETVETVQEKDGEKVERHTEYIWRTVSVSRSEFEGAHKMYWQPVVMATMQSFIYNYGKLSGLHKLSDKSTDTDNTTESDSSSEGEMIAEYAQQFIGNPYKYGGTSLTDGCDCSGFVMKVYEHFGYTLPHSSASQRKLGEQVCSKNNYSEALLQPGDIVCYDGHVGIYIGKGKIVNASNEKVGITTYNVLYRKDLITVRRMLDGRGILKQQATQQSTITNRDNGANVQVSPLGTAKKTGDGAIPVTMQAKKSTTKKSTTADSYKGADKKLVGNDTPSKMWNFFKAKGLSDLAVAAILGNCEQESHFNPRCHTSGTSFYGLFQWGENSSSQRWTNLKERYPGGEYEILNQLKFAWLEMTKGGRSKTLTLLSRATHLDYINESDRGAVWIFAYYFEGCVSDKQKYGIQDYDNRFKYAQKWLSKFGGKNGTVTDGKIYNAGDVGLDDAGIGYVQPQVLGTYDGKTGLVTLSETDISNIMEDFKPQVNYDFDLVSDTKDKYTFEECKQMKNNGLENDGGDPSTEEGIVEWYTPTSTVNTISLPYCDVTYSGNVPSTYEFNESRWENIMSRYVPYYSESLFMELVETFPKGSDFTSTFEYYKSLSDGSSSSTPANNQNISNAEGTYDSMDNVKPSIKIPENAGGMSIPLYLQTDSRWKDIPFGGGYISTSGCSVTSLAMVLSYLKQECIYPDDIVKWTGAKKYYSEGSGASWNIFGDVAKHWGLKCTQQTVNAGAIKRALQAGYPVIVSATGKGTTKEFTKRGHFIVLRGLTSSGKVLVNDPNDNTTNKMHYMKSYSANFIVSECTENGNYKKGMWIIKK